MNGSRGTSNISDSVENQSKNHNEYIDIENNKVTGITKNPHSTLKKRRKHQRLTRDEKHLIFKKSKIKELM